MKSLYTLFLFLIFSINQCFILDPKPCDCKDIDDIPFLAGLSLLSQSQNRTSNYSCELQSENLCFEFQNHLARKSDGSFCKTLEGIYSEKLCDTNNKIGSCFLADAGNLKKIYYHTVWTQASSQTDCTNLKGTWTE